MSAKLETTSGSRTSAVVPPALAYPPTGLAVAILLILVVATIFSYIDRTILSLLVVPIQRDLLVDDLQISLILGPTFAVFYALMGWPLGWMSDRYDRLRLVAVGIVLWSVMTSLSGLSQEYWQLLLARVGVAVGEAVLLPSAISLVTDCFPVRLRTRMLGLLGMSIFWGTGLSFLLGGLLIRYVTGLAEAGALPGGLRGWQVVMILVGAPGLLIALVLAVLPEPRRQRGPKGAFAPPPVSGTLPQVRAFAEYGYLFGASGLMAIVTYSTVSWAPTYLVRAHGWTAAQAGVSLGACFLVATTAIIYGATFAADRLAARGRRDGKYVVAGWCTLIALPFTLAIGLVHDSVVFVVAASVALGTASACIAMAPAAVTDITLAGRRGRAMGFYQMVVGVIGGGIGPPAVALLGKQSAGNPSALGFALCLVTSVGFLVTTAIFWMRRPAFIRVALAVSEVEKA